MITMYIYIYILYIYILYIYIIWYNYIHAFLVCVELGCGSKKKEMSPGRCLFLWDGVHSVLCRSESSIADQRRVQKIIHFWVVPPPSNCGNEGLGWDSLLKMVHNPAKNHGINYLSTGAGFFHQQYQSFAMNWLFSPLWYDRMRGNRTIFVGDSWDFCR